MVWVLGEVTRVDNNLAAILGKITEEQHDWTRGCT